MKINRNFRTLYFLLVVLQIILCNYSNLGPYVMLSMLPAMVLCIPLSVGTPLCLLIAFVSGLSVDWLSEGLIGLGFLERHIVAFDFDNNYLYIKE